MSQITSLRRPPTVTAAGVLALLLGVGAALLSIGHLGIEIPLVSAFGPGGDRVVLSAAIAFAVGTAIYTLVGVGLLRLRAWAWAAGIAVSALSIPGGIREYRGTASAIGILLSVVVLALLLTPQARSTLRPRR